MLSGDCNVCINGKMPSYSATCVECGLSRKNYKPITNADRIRGMTDEELAEFFHNTTFCDSCFIFKNECGTEKYSCKQRWLDWLKQEAK